AGLPAAALRRAGFRRCAGQPLPRNVAGGVRAAVRKAVEAGAAGMSTAPDDMLATDVGLNLPINGLRLIEASAGTGKTFTLATLYLRALLEQRRRVPEVLVVTFTEAATAELRLRLRARLVLASRLLADFRRGAISLDDDAGLEPEHRLVCATLARALGDEDTAEL